MLCAYIAYILVVFAQTLCLILFIKFNLQPNLPQVASNFQPVDLRWKKEFTNENT